MAVVRLGLAGVGAWGRNYLRTIAGLPGVRLSAAASGNPAIRSLLPPGCVVVPSWRELINEPIDGLIIATPTGSHIEIGMAALDRGLPLLVEKPLAMDAEQARALAKKAAEKRVSVMVEHTLLFHPAYRKIKSLVSRFGGVRRISTEAGRLGPFRLDTPVLWDWGSHDIALCLDLVRTTPQRCAARQLATAVHEGQHGESLQIDLDFPGGITAMVRISNIYAKRTRRIEVRCEQAALAYDQDQPGALAVDEGGKKSTMPLVSELPLTVAVREFAAMVAGRRFDISSLELGVAVTEVLSRCAAKL